MWMIRKGVPVSTHLRRVSAVPRDRPSQKAVSYTHLDVYKRQPSYKIGELAMEKLRGIDEVAYVRFASVYRQFKDIDSFMKELQTCLLYTSPLLHPLRER